MQKEIQKLLREFDLKRIEKELEPLIRPGIRLTKGQRGEVRGCSRIGGLPDVSKKFVWPRRHGNPMAFLTQIRCEDIHSEDREGLLPASGMLYFFYDTVDSPGGFSAEDKGGSAVIYEPDALNLVRASPPAFHAGTMLLEHPFRINFQSIPTLPASESLWLEPLRLSQDETDSYSEFKSEFAALFGGRGEGHQMLGHPLAASGAMEDQCQYVSNGIEDFDEEDPRCRKLSKGREEWRLLLQVDTDDDLDIMWGDCALLYIWIKEQDLRAMRFDSLWTLQSG